GERRLSVEDCLSLAGRLAGALGLAHKRGILHRDVKPSNIVLEDGDVRAAKLVDWGVARVINRSSLTQAGAIIGTPGFMAPEQVRGDRPSDPRTDVFSLGCVLYRCLAGDEPFP